MKVFKAWMLFIALEILISFITQFLPSVIAASILWFVFSMGAYAFSINLIFKVNIFSRPFLLAINWIYFNIVFLFLSMFFTMIFGLIPLIYKGLGFETLINFLMVITFTSYFLTSYFSYFISYTVGYVEPKHET